jgi:hypothetical protein
MHRSILLLSAAIVLAGAAPAQTTQVRPLSTVHEIASLGFRHAAVAELVMTEVVFGIKDNRLVFAKSRNTYRGKSVVHDDSAHVDVLVEDLAHLPRPVQLKWGEDTLTVSSLALRQSANGVRVVRLAGTGSGDVGTVGNWTCACVAVNPARAA